jgi:hypothetical protein
MLAAAGYVDIRQTDLTPDFAVVTRAWMEQYAAHQGELVSLLGRELFEERQADRRAQLAAIEDGILRRSLVVASLPPARTAPSGSGGPSPGVASASRRAGAMARSDLS